MNILFNDLLLLDWRFDGQAYIRCVCMSLYQGSNCQGFISINVIGNIFYTEFNTEFFKFASKYANYLKCINKENIFTSDQEAKDNIDEFLLNYHRYEKLESFS